MFVREAEKNVIQSRRVNVCESVDECATARKTDTLTLQTTESMYAYLIVLVCAENLLNDVKKRVEVDVRDFRVVVVCCIWRENRINCLVIPNKIIHENIIFKLSIFLNKLI